MSHPTAKQFVAVLSKLKHPGGKQPLFLQAHYEAPGRALTATNLSHAAGYKDFRGVNLAYGLLAKRIGVALGHSKTNLDLLVEFVAPKSVTNKEWLLVMRPTFAEALKQVGWVA